MRKTWLVIRHEFSRYVRRRAFLFAVFGLPLLLVAVFAVTFLVIAGRASDALGVVDDSGLMMDTDTYNETLGPREAPLISFAGAEEARSALNDGDIQAFIAVPQDYPEDPNVVLYHLGDPFEGIGGDVNRYLRRSLLVEAHTDEAVVELLAYGRPSTRTISLREGDAQDDFTAFLFPFVVGVLLIMSIFTTAGYLLQTVVDEKENRTMEILITSISPEQLITGKIIGLVLLGLLQTAVWTGAALVVYLIARGRLPEQFSIAPSPTLILIALAWFLPFYLMMASFMAAIGVSVTEVSEGQQASSVVSLLAAAPMWLLSLLISSPDSPLSVALSLVPFTSPISILMRWSLTTIPIWQLAASWLILAGTAALALLLVSRVLRVGMLRYGQRLTLREVFGSLR